MGIFLLGLIIGPILGSRNPFNNENLEVAVTHYAPQTHWNIAECPQKIAQNLTRAKFPYARAGKRSLYLNFSETNSPAFVYCVPDIDNDGKTGRVIAGAVQFLDGPYKEKFDIEWNKFIHAVEGAVNLDRPK